MVATARMTAPRSHSIPGAPTSIDVRGVARHGVASATTGAGRAISSSGSPSARRTWRRWRAWAARPIVALRRGRARSSAPTRSVTGATPIVTTCSGPAAWFEDEELAQRVVEGETGLISHLLRGYGRDGMWYEGENYHLFALRGLLTGAGWARLAGVDFREDHRLADRLHAALLAPSLTALPDFTYPARKDSRFGVSLAQPGYLEIWEVGLARMGTSDIGPWLEEIGRA